MSDKHKPKNPRAFPVKDKEDGMTLKDYAAIKFGQTLLQVYPESSGDAIARDSYYLANQFLLEREANHEV